MRTYGSVELIDDGRVWKVTGEPHVILRMKRVFAKANDRTPGELLLSNTPENCRDLQWFMQRYPLQVDPKHDPAMWDGAAAYQERLLSLEKILAGDYTPRPFQLAIPARDYQKQAAELYLANGFLLLADDVGTGKTASAICALVEPSTRPALVVTLAHLTRQWQEEVRKFAPTLRTHILKKGTPYELAQNGVLPDVIITNYHKLHGWADVLRRVCHSVTFDECQELRRSESQKYTAAVKLTEDTSTMRYRQGLSATPIYNYGGEMINVVNILSRDALGSHGEFYREWCHGKNIVTNPKAFGSFLREKCIMLRRTRAECGREIPPITRIPHMIDSDASALDDIKGSAAELAKIILAETPATKGDAFKAGGHFDAMMRQATGISKAPYVADFVRLLVESGESVVVFGWHHEVYRIWMKKLEDLHPVLFTGEESPKQKEESKQAFVSGKTKILISSLRAGAGLDGLQYASRTAVVGELDWSPGVIEQCEGRVARDGQKDPVMSYYLLAEDGADPVMADVLGLKKEQIDGIRSPEKDILEKTVSTGDHVKRLARHYLDKIGQ